MFSLQAIVLLLFMGGLIAFIGDRVGRIIGRRRLSIAYLRPKYTAVIITIISGLLIVSLTLVTIIAVSEKARTALFGLDTLKKNYIEMENKLQEKSEQLSSLTVLIEKTEQKLLGRQKELESAHQEIDKLQKVRNDLDLRIEKLNREKQNLTKNITKLKEIISQLATNIKATREGEIIFRINEPMLVTTIKGEESKDFLEQTLMKILSQADSIARYRSISLGKFPQSSERMIFLPQAEMEEAINYLANKKNKEIVVRIVSASNTLLGEQIIAHFELFENKLVFKAKEVITSGIVRGNNSEPEVEQELKSLLIHVNTKAKEQGIVPDPSGLVGNISYARLYELANAIAQKRELVTLDVIAAKDIYTIGPVEIDFVIPEDK